jgi:hypothetical protein
MTEETKELTQEVFKSDMKTSDLMAQLIQEHSEEEIEDAVVGVVEDKVEVVNSERREMMLYTTARQIGAVIESEALVEFAERRIQQIT